MSERMMSVTEAREWAEFDKSTRPTPRAARTIVAQTERIERVRNALSSIARVKAESDAASVHGHDNPEWHEATADALEYALDLITEALGDQK